MLRAVPAPFNASRLLNSTPIVAYIRLDLMAGTLGPATTPGMSRLQAYGRALMPALAIAGMVNTVPLAGTWPETSGFDLDSVDAVLTAPAASGALPTKGLRIMAGAPRLHDAVRVGSALQRHGFTVNAVGGTTVFSRGEDNDIQLENRVRGDPFNDGLGLAQRVVVTSAGLLVASETNVVLRAVEAQAGRAKSLADSDAMHAIMAGLNGRTVMQAIVLSPTAGLGIAVQPSPWLIKPPWERGPGGPPLPQWDMAALAQVAAPTGPPHHLVILVLPHPETAVAALQARIEAARGGAFPLAIDAVDVRVLPRQFGAAGVVVADIQVTSGINSIATPTVHWWVDIQNGVSTPITFDPTLRSPGGGRRL